jgi:ribosomal protein S27AE
MNPAVRARTREQWRDSWARQPDERRAAKSAVYCAVKAGKLKPPKRCSGCGRFAGRIHGHHDDYSKPLAVRWLCARCHGAIHTLSA